MNNYHEFQHRLRKSLKNNLSFRLLEKAKEFILTGETLKTDEFNKRLESFVVDPNGALECINIEIHPFWEETESDFWKEEYQKLIFKGGSTEINPIDTLNFDVIADHFIYSDWCMFSQSIKGYVETNLKEVK
jgi:hypothetical protein